MPPGSARTWPIGGLDRYEHDPTLTLAGGRRHPCPRRTSRPESQDALALAIENNTDIELQRFALPQGNPEWLRAKGGGLTRGLNFTLLEVPTGVGGSLSPVLTNAVSGARHGAGSSVANATGVGRARRTANQSSVAGDQPQSNGTAIPS